MKSMELHKVLKTFSDMMNGCEAKHCANILEAGSALLLEKPNMKLADFCRQLHKISVQDRKDCGPKIGQYLEILNKMRPFIDIAAKPAIRGDIEIWMSTLGSQDAATIDDFVSAAKAVFAAPEKNDRPSRKQKGAAKRLPKTELEILVLVSRLESVLGSREFSAIYEEVAEKGYLSAAEAKELCRKFTGKTAKNANDALKLIWQRHQSLLDSDAMGEATKGHIAA